MGNEDKYYVYALIDPRTDKPFYIGKGFGRRCQAHREQAKDTANTSLKCNTIRKIWKLDLDYDITKSELMCEEDALELECLMISEYGRKDCSAGCLTNHTDGGEGSSGYIHSEEAKQQISEALTGRTITDENKERLRKECTDNPMILREGVLEKVTGDNHWSAKLDGKDHPLKGRKQAKEVCIAISKALTGRISNPCSDETKDKIRQAHLGRKVKDTSKFHWKRETVECPYCDKVGSVSNMKRWHFDNCKSKGEDNV